MLREISGSLRIVDDSAPIEETQRLGLRPPVLGHANGFIARIEKRSFLCRDKARGRWRNPVEFTLAHPGHDLPEFAIVITE